MLQIRISLPTFENGIGFEDSIILENADNITLTKQVNSDKESISFTVPPNDPKVASGISYARWWECWDTETGTRLNYGPIEEIQYKTGAEISVTGAGRSRILKDFYKDVQTFYSPIDQFLDELRYENLAGQPRTSTIIDDSVDPTSDRGQYYGLSLRTKDSAIDEQTGFISIGRDLPTRTTIKSDQFWAGTGKSDYLIVDLGEPQPISKAKILLPWWGGATQFNNRAYDWSWGYSDTNTSYTTVYDTGSPNHLRTLPPDGVTLYFGENGFEQVNEKVLDQSVTARYWKLNIADTHAWYGNALTGVQADEWDWECNDSDVFDSEYKESPQVSGGPIPKTTLTPANDCYASAVELGIYKKIINLDHVSKLAYHQIQDDSRQITFFHAPTAEEMKAGGKKYEPGTFFRNITVTTSGLTVQNEFNTVIYKDYNETTMKLPAYTRYVAFDEPTQVLTVDSWIGQIDPFSYGGSYSYTTVENDYLMVEFRGVSFKWYATIPSTATAATVRIQIRQKVSPPPLDINDLENLLEEIRDGNEISLEELLKFFEKYKDEFKRDDPIVLKGEDQKPPNWAELLPIKEDGDSPPLWDQWTEWITLEDSYVLPTGVAAYPVWEIPVEWGYLSDNTSYQIRITNLVDGGYCSVDAFAGYWSGTYNEYNEDDARLRNYVIDAEQLNEETSSQGSIYKWIGGNFTKLALNFEGDRVIVYSKKAPGYGKITIALGKRAEPGGDSYYEPVPIPNTPDGVLEVILNRSTEIPQYVIFDSADYFNDETQTYLPWGVYTVGIYRDTDQDEAPIYLDGIGVHETSGITVKFLTTSYLDILDSTAEALQLEWNVTENGLLVVPRIGADTNVIISEGQGTTIRVSNVEDIKDVASMLFASGADIDGLPLSFVGENKNTKKLLGRTVQRLYDNLRNISDYYTLANATRTELLRRQTPVKRISVERSEGIEGLQIGDSFIVKTALLEQRVRIIEIQISQSSSSGMTWTLECETWPRIS